MKTLKRENWKDFLSIYGPGLVVIALGLLGHLAILHFHPTLRYFHKNNAPISEA